MNRLFGSMCAALALSCSAPGGSAAQTPASDQGAIFADRFETDTAGWTVYGPAAKIEQTTDSAHVKEGKGALHFSFHIGGEAGDKQAGPPIDALVRGTPDNQLARMAAISFWARSDIAAPYTLALSEKDGGRYITMFWLQADQWQHVSLRPADFWLTDGPNDPKDPDGKLDLDQVENISLINLWSILEMGAGESPESVALFSHARGTHNLWLDDFSALTDAPPLDAPEPVMPAKPQGVWIDDLRRDTLAWILLGEAKMRLDSDAPFKNRAIRLDYTQVNGQYIVIAHDMHRSNLAHMDRLTFEAASAKSSKLLIQLEEKGGAKYNVIVDLPGDSTPTRKSISFSDFTLADDSPKDPDGQLDVDQIKTLTLIDITGAFGLAQQKNTLWIGPIRAISLSL